MAKFGVFNHFLFGEPGSEMPDAVRAEDSVLWNRRVEGFDVERLARQLSECGASYYGITLMQGRKFLCAPNAAFDGIAGTKPGEACAERDLILELSDALRRRGIGLMLYFTGDGPYKDVEIGRKFGFMEPRRGNVTLAFSRRWAQVLEEYACRYADRVSMWWIDGCYDYFGYDEEKLTPYYEAVRRGNPHALVTMNNGVKPTLYRYYSREDYTSGEQNDFTVLPESSSVGGAIPHILAPLGKPLDAGKPWSGWRRPGCKRDGAYLHEYVRRVNEKAGLVTIDICIHPDGTLEEEQLRTLSQI